MGQDRLDLLCVFHANVTADSKRARDRSLQLGIVTAGHSRSVS